MAGPVAKVPHKNGAMALSPPTRLFARAPVCSRQIDTVVCQLLSSHGIGPIGGALDCAAYAGLVAAGTAIIYTAVQNSGSGTKTAGKRSESSLAALLSEQFDFDSIDAMSIAKRSRDHNVSDDSARYMDERFSIIGLKHHGSTSDAIVTTYTDGTGHIWTTPTPADATTLTKRHDGPGFKINYCTIKFAGGLGSAPSFPSLNAALAGGIAQDWASRANNDKIDEYIVTTGITKPKLETIGIRIIAENNGFGEEYESVDNCGKLRSSHDEL
ncbi:hypothetical protein DL95DRAFT_407857 [Leptodontidium sp. 2 PMI_412]|nr:hypothetical protein DL95DRAFT_407857 [Leptodontidium sp. 2 PMI_412]